MMGNSLMDEKEACLMNPLQLAYMGDAVWEEIVRKWLILQRMNVHHMHTECVRRVNAGAQAQALSCIKPLLTECEQALVQRGRNAHAKHPSPKHQDPADYAEATGFETLLGFLFLTGQTERLVELKTIILEEMIQNA